MAEEQEDLGHMHIVTRSFPRETRHEVYVLSKVTFHLQKCKNHHVKCSLIGQESKKHYSSMQLVSLLRHVQLIA